MKPKGRADCAAGEGFARGSAVGALDAVALAEEEDSVVADHVAATNGLDANFVCGARADVAVPFIARILGQIAASSLGHCLG